MKVVMDFENTELIPVAKGRGVKTFNKWFDELKSELSKIPNVRQIGISHADGLELANGFKEGLQAIFKDMDIPYYIRIQSLQHIQEKCLCYYVLYRLRNNEVGSHS